MLTDQVKQVLQKLFLGSVIQEKKSKAFIAGIVSSIVLLVIVAMTGKLLGMFVVCMFIHRFVYRSFKDFKYLQTLIN